MKVEMWRTHSCVQRSHSCERVFATGHKTRPQEWGRGTQECVRHGAATIAVVFLLLFAGGVGHAQIFDYDKSAPLNFTQKQLDNRDGVRLSSCSFETKGGKATGYLVEPTLA